MRLRSLLFGLRGRIPRGTLWWVGLWLAVAFVVLFAGLEAVVGRASTLVLYPLLFWIAFALAAKRYHDLGKSPAWLLLLVMPILGVAWVALELGFRRGTQGENQYGPDPLIAGLDYLVVK